MSSFYTFPLTHYQLFCNDLIWQMQVWHQQGDRLILMMGANEHMITGEFCKRLTMEETGLELEEISHKAWGKTEPNTRADGSIHIDGVWASKSLEIG